MIAIFESEMIIRGQLEKWNNIVSFFAHLIVLWKSVKILDLCKINNAKLAPSIWNLFQLEQYLKEPQFLPRLKLEETTWNYVK